MKIKFLLGSLLTAICVSASETAPKYIFYFIGDGMGHGQVMSADTYRRLVQKQQDKMLMMQFPIAGVCTTYSASTPVTDSAAAGTALATGSKTKNNMLGMNADTIAVRNVADDLAERGYGIGLVTNVCPDDATPGAFYAHVPARWMWEDIALQFADSPVKFLAGSMLRGTKTNGKYNGLYDKIKDKGVAIVRGVENLEGVNNERILLLNTDTVSQNMGYAVDSPKGNTLSQYTDAAIAHMQRTSPDKFFLMVEGGNIDWAGHDNDGITIVREVLAYDSVLQKAYDFYLKHPDETLIVVTADHETGGMTVGQKSVGYNNYPKVVDRQAKSKAQFSDECWAIIKNNTPITWEEMKQKLADYLGFYSKSEISAEREQRLINAFNNTFIKNNGKSTTGLYSTYPEFVEVAYTIQNEIAGYGFTSGKHTGNPVPVFAIGVGAEEFGGVLDNTDIPNKLRELTK
ncbi:MAG: alkaline phosphatase [Bacteroides sp.]|nr:alkaline phosphatase [Bacteroides sp.]MCM1378653.1 alkaline phosphatase [Bacteroides sp.]MCM1444926.1 alkaline phosphatase [Prevotella sp.]